jgi:uncharacterized protein (DUF2267 family)
MSTTGLEVFDKSIHTTNTWLKEIADEMGTDRHLAWQALGAVLRVLRDRLTADDAAHLAAQLPLVVRGAFYDQYRPATQPDVTIRSRDAFIGRVASGLGGAAPVSAESAVAAVLAALGHHVTAAEAAKVQHTLPAEIRTLWPAAHA